MTDARVCLVTLPDLDTARKIAKDIVETGLCACANLLPGTESIYRWQGKIEHGSEVLMVIKTRQSRLKELDAKIRQLHPYAVYEFIALPVDYGNENYLQWLYESTS
ncbi:MAG: divalent-cation tolerance protein CutA [Candidatus Riflebacteria bacterium HGW-Riflebacteria-2]|jgi:periplasmic divalent cation tolerance protein|nr:MAG: divalent-cation tolerance protein CutA [Candidatus Riflebacteria bacterium HGW-Riflebacteria-2]